MGPTETTETNLARGGRALLGDLPAWQLALRLLIVAGELILILWFGEKNAPFFYQGF